MNVEAVVEADSSGLLGAIVDKAESDVVLLIVIVAILLIAVGKPLYKIFTENLTNRRKRDGAREDRLIGVIQGNSSVMAELKILLMQSENSCATCKEVQLAKFQHLEGMAQANQLSLNDMARTIMDASERIKEIQKNK